MRRGEAHPRRECRIGGGSIQGRDGSYDCSMSRFTHELREHVAMFFTNWRNPNYTVPEKLVLTVKNRSLGLVRGGCCGNHGQPGC